MKIKLKNAFLYFNKKPLNQITKVVGVLCLTTFFALAPTVVFANNINDSNMQQRITGTISDANGQPLAGANVLEKGTTNGVQVDFDGKYSLTLSNQNAILVVSYLGFITKEVPVGTKTNINIILDEDISTLDEVVVVGYGTQKKVNLTAAVSVIGSEAFENRPTANAIQSLQGTVPGLVISNTAEGGQPGATPDINIRGFITSGGDGDIGDAGPLVLIDGIEMSLGDIDPEDVESVSVLKDAAAASIYGSRAAGGALLVTTKSGKNMNGDVKITYSNNFQYSRPSVWPNSASPINYAYAIQDARRNNNEADYWTEEEYGYIIQNMTNPGSAPSGIADIDNNNSWNVSAIGQGATSATDWQDFLFKDFAEKRKHNLSISGGDQKLNYYFSVGSYEEEGLLVHGKESFERYNVDAKFSAKANDWLTIEFVSKFLKSNSDFPTDTGRGSVLRNTSRILDVLTKLKPTLPTVDDFGNPLLQAQYPIWENQRYQAENNQIVLSPRFIIEPIKDLRFNAQLNYRRNNNSRAYKILTTEYTQPDGTVAFDASQSETSYEPTYINNEYFSPNLFASYDKSIDKHNFHATIGYQSESYNYDEISASTSSLISDNYVSISTSALDDATVNDALSHWAIQSVFSRFRYNFDEKYLFEFSYRRDGSSRFEPENRWAGFPSYSAGYNIAKEEFWPFEAINTFKLRGSYGTLGNQNVDNYLYISSIDADNNGTFLFDGSQELFANTPILESESLTWETVKTTDIGFDLGAFNNKLNVGFSWYRTDIEGMAAPGIDLPEQLGTDSPLTNIGTSRVQGWEIEASWRQQLGDFSYNIRAVLSDYKRTIVEYPNETNDFTQTYWNGKDLGEIWGLQWDGWFMTDDEYDTYPIDQSFLPNSGTWNAGDTKYKDLNEDNVIDRGEWVLGDTGDFSVIGNSTPRYQYSFNIGLNYKNWDMNMFIQGVGKRDVLVSNHQRFRGPAQGELHALVYEEHLDYFRPENTTSPLGPNTDAYFPAPYSNNPGANNKNYRYAVDRYLQNGAYARLKNMQIGFTIPKKLTDKYKIKNFRIFISGENLLTISDMLFYDPEFVAGSFGSAQAYPLSTTFSTGVNISF
ncbi:SusC/RagA family TonB-linked outer membrane protein [Flavivirga jejuensis]|uniref:TonB-dependent receptor n=1 Tax=Flavivirga jejuensis TaxID=870487 RepID=A0ABT8WNQ6_9FLAO|nr:TonB-dependent receptor [Flavivirga jejuensis]MDO5974562.1 TonB-dependent receptor [Flavivirga jejuensis]